MGSYSGVRPNRKDTFSAVGGMAVTAADSDISFAASTAPAAYGSDVNPPSRFPRGFTVGVAGTLKLTFQDGSIMTYVASELVPGFLYPWSVIRVWATGTTATVFKVYW